MRLPRKTFRLAPFALTFLTQARADPFGFSGRVPDGGLPAVLISLGFVALVAAWGLDLRRKPVVTVRQLSVDSRPPAAWPVRPYSDKGASPS